MRKGATAAIATILIAAGLIGSPGASAATEVGYPCLANDSVADWTVVALSREGAAAPPSFPTDGVVTGWKIEVEPGLEPRPQTLGVYRPAGAEDGLLTVAESAPELVGPGAHLFPTRIPIRAGDLIGTHGSGETLFCDKVDGDNMRYFDGAAPVGTTNQFVFGNSSGMPVVAILEPDADGDGFGDETQDLCPQLAIATGACPLLRVAVRSRVRKRSIVISVTSNLDATGRVNGQVGWPRSERRRRRGEASRGGRLIVGLSGGIKPVGAGAPATFRVRLPKLVRRRLAKLPPRRSLTAKLLIAVEDGAGRVDRRRARVKLRGRHRRH